MPYTNQPVITSVKGTWSTQNGFSFNTIETIPSIPLSAQLEVERVFSADRSGNTQVVTDFLTDINVKQSDKRNAFMVPANGFWYSKDEQVNRVIEELRKRTLSCWLWQIDADEQWTAESMTSAEAELENSVQIAGAFAADCRVGKHLRAIGDWGECRTYGYIRLWNWNGQSFICHELPLLEGAGKEAPLLTPRFTHHNYYFERDVAFKDQWYGVHEGILERWKLINSVTSKSFPLHISNLITGKWGTTNSAIIWID